jgi:hypothetical protein
MVSRRARSSHVGLLSGLHDNRCIIFAGVRYEIGPGYDPSMAPHAMQLITFMHRIVFTVQCSNSTVTLSIP